MLAEEQQALTDDLEATPETNVPLLEDVIAGGMAVEEQFLTGAETLDTESEEFPGLDEEMIKALMGDEWREATRKILNEARQKIDDHKRTLTPDATNELSRARRVRKRVRPSVLYPILSGIPARRVRRAAWKAF